MAEVCDALREERRRFLMEQKGMTRVEASYSSAKAAWIRAEIGDELGLTPDEVLALLPDVNVSVDIPSGLMRDMHVRLADVPTGTGARADAYDLMMALSLVPGLMSQCKSLSLDVPSVGKGGGNAESLFSRGLRHFEMVCRDDAPAASADPSAIEAPTSSLTLARDTLVCLVLEGTGIGDSEAAVENLVGFLRRNSTLRHLSLRGNRLTREHMMRIAAVLDTPANALVTLRVCDNPCADAVADVLASAAWLRDVIAVDAPNTTYIVQRDFLDARSEAPTLQPDVRAAMVAWLAGAVVLPPAAEAGAKRALVPLSNHASTGAELAIVSAPRLHAPVQAYMTRVFGDRAAAIQRPVHWVGVHMIAEHGNHAPQMNALCLAGALANNMNTTFAGDVPRLVLRAGHLWRRCLVGDPRFAAVAETHIVYVDERLAHVCTFVLRMSRYVTPESPADAEPAPARSTHYDGEALLVFVRPPPYAGTDIAECPPVAQAIKDTCADLNLRFRELVQTSRAGADLG
jgi:hypothetical protein